MSIPSPRSRQGSFDDLGTPLAEVTFVVVDLETTGGSPATSQITEIGAVKVRGGERLGEFHSLVNPMTSIPPFIAVLTGITDAMVATAPTLAAVLPAFLEWLGPDAVLVAHNAPFDVGFLRAAAQQLAAPWPQRRVVDTARLARRVLTRDEAPNCKLATLARVFRCEQQPSHRALDDARATVEVLHGLLARVGGLGVHSLEDLSSFSVQVSAAQRRKRALAEQLPQAPGVYLFRDGAGRVLYVGTSRNLRARVRQYFLASEPRTRMAEMVALAERVDAVVCAHPLEASVRELRAIAEYKPPFNRRSRFPERAVFCKITVEPFPRLSIVRRVLADGATYFGPFPSTRAAELAAAAVYQAIPIRQCTQRIPARGGGASCVLAQLGRCVAPCTGAVDVAAYGERVETLVAALSEDPRPILGAGLARVAELALHQRYEEAALHRDRVRAFVRAAARTQRLTALAAVRELVAAAPRTDGGWDLAVVRHGRLAGAGVARPGLAVRPQVDAVVAGAQAVRPGPGPTPAASAEEMELVLGWLGEPGTRLVELDGVWASPVRGAGGLREWATAGERGAADPFADRRGLRPAHRPVRAAAG